MNRLAPEPGGDRADGDGGRAALRREGQSRVEKVGVMEDRANHNTRRDILESSSQLSIQMG